MERIAERVEHLAGEAIPVVAGEPVGGRDTDPAVAGLREAIGGHVAISEKLSNPEAHVENIAYSCPLTIFPDCDNIGTREWGAGFHPEK